MWNPLTRANSASGTYSWPLKVAALSNGKPANIPNAKTAAPTDNRKKLNIARMSNANSERTRPGNQTSNPHFAFCILRSAFGDRGRGANRLTARHLLS
jgi:hypothetical protein